MELHQCPECQGTGAQTLKLDRRWKYDHMHTAIECKNCDGTGWLDEHGEPFYLEPEAPCANNSTTTKSPENSRS